MFILIQEILFKCSLYTIITAKIRRKREQKIAMQQEKKISDSELDYHGYALDHLMHISSISRFWQGYLKDKYPDESPLPEDLVRYNELVNMLNQEAQLIYQHWRIFLGGKYKLDKADTIDDQGRIVRRTET
jgi:hypothetical protein